MDIQELEQRLIDWRADRSIDTNSTGDAQMRCYEEERNELKDAMGDMIVTLINSQALGFNKPVISFLMEQVYKGAEVMSIDINECMDMAWAEIENRIGLVRETGKFTKWKDLTHAERLSIATQLNGAPDNIRNDAQECCSEKEWLEIIDRAKYPF